MEMMVGVLLCCCLCFCQLRMTVASQQQVVSTGRPLGRMFGESFNGMTNGAQTNSDPARQK
jgi:hypothetical protein